MSYYSGFGVQGLEFYRVYALGSRAVPVAELEDVLLSVYDADAAVNVHLRNIPSVKPAVL